MKEPWQKLKNIFRKCPKILTQVLQTQMPKGISQVIQISEKERYKTVVIAGDCDLPKCVCFV